MYSAMVVTFSTPFPGREKKALEFAIESAEFWGKKAADGKCTEPEMFLSTTGRSIWFVKGEREVLEEISYSDEGLALLAKGELYLADFTNEILMAGDTVDHYLGIFSSVALAA